MHAIKPVTDRVKEGRENGDNKRGRRAALWYLSACQRLGLP